MNVNQLKYFCAVVREGSFTRAAASQGVSVQAVSHALARLEEELGRGLFERGSRGVQLTEFGASIVGRAERVVTAFRDVEVLAGAEGDAGQVAVGPDVATLGLVVPHFEQAARMCAALSRVASVGVGTRCEISVRDGREAVALMSAGRLDAMLTVGRFLDPGFDSLEAGTLSTAVFLHETHPLAHERSVSLAQLAPYPVSYGRGVDDFNETVVNLYHDHGMASPMRVITTDEELRRLTVDERGFILAVGIRGFRPAAGWRMVALDPADVVPVPVCLVTPQAAASEAARRLVSFVRGGIGPLLRLL